MSPNQSLAAISLPLYAEHDGENPITEMGWLDLKPFTYNCNNFPCVAEVIFKTIITPATLFNQKFEPECDPDVSPQHTTNKQQSQWVVQYPNSQSTWNSKGVPYIPNTFLSSSATVSDIAKQWGESGNENEQTEPDNVADENAVVAQALLNDV